MKNSIRAQEILRRLKRTYRTPGPFITWATPLELVVATVLSAQCTDERVNKVTRTLFKKYRTVSAYAKADLKKLEHEIYSTGFYRSKAKYLKGIGQILETEFNGTVPNRFEELLALPGVSYKSANLIMAKVYGIMTGIAVDTHVKRVAPRLGLTHHHDPVRIARDLERLYPTSDYLDVNEYLIMHGRAVCKPKPRCMECVLLPLCPFGMKTARSRSMNASLHRSA